MCLFGTASDGKRRCLGDAFMLTSLEGHPPSQHWFHTGARTSWGLGNGGFLIQFTCNFYSIFRRGSSLRLTLHICGPGCKGSQKKGSAEKLPIACLLHSSFALEGPFWSRLTETLDSFIAGAREGKLQCVGRCSTPLMHACTYSTLLEAGDLRLSGLSEP